jgi:hypothetical protein
MKPDGLHHHNGSFGMHSTIMYGKTSYHNGENEIFMHVYNNVYLHV